MRARNRGPCTCKRCRLAYAPAPAPSAREGTTRFYAANIGRHLLDYELAAILVQKDESLFYATVAMAGASDAEARTTALLVAMTICDRRLVFRHAQPVAERPS